MDIAGKKVAILVDTYFEQSEFEEPLRALKDAGAEVTVIGASTKDLQALQHVEKGDTFTADLVLADATSDDYDALVLPGGVVNADHLRVNEMAQEWVRDFLDSNKPLAAICHAPWLLVSADVVDGRTLTSFHTLQDDIENAGGSWVDKEVEVDGSLITSRKPDDLPAFSDALIRMLADEDADRSQSALPAANDEELTEDNARLQGLGYDKKRDEITPVDEQDILGDEDANDPEALHPSGTVPRDEQDGTQ